MLQRWADHHMADCLASGDKSTFKRQRPCLDESASFFKAKLDDDRLANWSKLHQ
jgi:hypothetical protein